MNSDQFLQSNGGIGGAYGLFWIADCHALPAPYAISTGARRFARFTAHAALAITLPGCGLSTGNAANGLFKHDFRSILAYACSQDDVRFGMAGEPHKLLNGGPRAEGKHMDRRTHA